jgi:hypothetical protein
LKSNILLGGGKMDHNTVNVDHPTEADEAPIFHDMSSGWHTCFGPISNMACGWPSGTCTAVITIISIIGFLGGMLAVLIYAIVAGNVNVLLAIISLFSSGFSFVFGHYVGKSAALSTVNPTTTIAT